MSATSALQIGDARLNAHACCGKPRGCTMTHDGCAYLRHPWKRAMVFCDTTVRCQARGTDPETGEDFQCPLLNGHDGACQR